MTVTLVRHRHILTASCDDHCDDYGNSSSSHTDSLTYNVNPYDEDNWFEILIRVVVPALFGMIVLTGFIGNMVVVLVVSLYRRARTATSLLMLNLAVADLVFIFVCVPTTAARYALPVWPFGPVWCKVRVSLSSCPTVCCTVYIYVTYKVLTTINLHFCITRRSTRC